MKCFQGILNGVGLILLVSFSAKADTFNFIDSASTGFNSTDFSNVTLRLKKFDTSLGTLSGVTLELFGTINASTVSITNNASGSETFSAKAALELYTTNNSANTPASGDVELDTDPTGTFSSTGVGSNPVLLSVSGITLGATGSGACPAGTPSGSCSSVDYGPISVSDALSPVMMTIDPAAWGGYEASGGGTFSIDANTQAASFFGGGGGNVVINQITDANVSVKVIYTYASSSQIAPSTPEPASMVLMGSALLGLGFLRKRFLS